MRKAILILVPAMLLMACNAPFVAQPGTPTPMPSVPPQPTLTLTPTIALITPSATVTVEVTVSATAARTPRPELACKVLSQSIKSGSKFRSREQFDISWQIQNAGTATWQPGVVELAYAGGTKMFRYQPVPLTHSSPPGDIIGLAADMIAPRTPDTYTMVWALRQADNYFCKMAVTIKVQLK